MWQGRVLAIHIHAEEGARCVPLDEARLVAGRGIEGDASFAAAGPEPSAEASDQAITLIETEALAAIKRDYGIHLSAAESRRNVETEGVPLNHLVGCEFRVGDATCYGVELCEPCGYLEKMTRRGVTKALLHRGGLRARIVADGTLRPGDPVSPA